MTNFFILCNIQYMRFTGDMAFDTTDGTSGNNLQAYFST